IAHKKTLVYKYGCSNASFNRFGATPLLFWRAIQDAKRQGLEQFDLGRSDLDNEGLIAFKNHLGGQPTTLNYYRYPDRASAGLRQSSIAKNLYTLLPARIQATVSSRLYKHFG